MDNFDLDITYGSMSVEFIIKKMNSGDLIIPKTSSETTLPMWNIKTQQSFIESIFHEKKMHPLVLTTRDQVLYVRDGRQRLETIQRYMDNEFICGDSFYKDLSGYDKTTFLSCMLCCEFVSEPTDAQIDELCKTLNARDADTVRYQKMYRIVNRDSHLYHPDTVEYAKNKLKTLCPHTNVTYHYVELGLDHGGNVAICDNCGKGV